MPVDPLDEWKTDPFEPVLRDGRIWGRGADDDKGQSFMHVKALGGDDFGRRAAVQRQVHDRGRRRDRLGEHYARWRARHKELLRSDVILVWDTSMLGWDVPSITCGLRGLCYVQVTVTGLRPRSAFGSGPAERWPIRPSVLSKMIASLTDADGRADRPRVLRPGAGALAGGADGFRPGSVLRGRFLQEHRRAGNGGREGVLDHGAHRRAAVARRKRHLGRIYRRRRQDDHSVEGSRENFDAPGTRSGLSRDRPSVRRAFPFVRSPQRPCRRRGAARGLPVRVSDRSARLSRRRPGRRTDVRPGSLCRTIRAAASRSSARSRKSWASSRFCSDSGSTATRSTRRTRATDSNRASCAASRRSSGSTASSRQAGERCRAGLQVWS